jgi:hypothetical protein
MTAEPSGHLWLDANVHLPTLLKDMAKPENESYREQVCGYVDPSSRR